MTNITAFIQVSIEQSVSDEMESAKKETMRKQFKGLPKKHAFIASWYFLRVLQ